MYQVVCVLAAVYGMIFLTNGARGLDQDGALPAAGKKIPVLPGAQRGGAIMLPNQWSLRPAGKQIQLGDFPVNSTLHPGGHWLAVLHAGYGDHEIAIVDLKRLKMVSRVILDQAFYGLCFSPDGRSVYASGGEYEVIHAFRFEEGLLSDHREIKIAEPKEKFVPSGLAIDGTTGTLIAAAPWGNSVFFMPLGNPEKHIKLSLPPNSYPYGCLINAPRRQLYVSLWNHAAVAVIDLIEKRIVGSWPTEKHPTEMVLAPDGKRLFVACANSTKVSVIGTGNGKTLETISCALFPNAPSGNTPNSLSLTPDGQLLFVANADANNVAVCNVADAGMTRSLGFIPVGWYPTSIRYNPVDKRLYITNGKGTTPKANPQGPNPLLPNSQTIREYIGDLFRGTLEVVDLPTPSQMAAYSKNAYACSPLRADNGVAAEVSTESPIPRKVGKASPIKHCIYIIKENRTYDQVFGDMEKGNGDHNLCIFPEKVTPNHHKLAREFVLLDNFYVDGEVSADGHQWSMGAYATDFVEKTWPLIYRGSSHNKLTYPSEGKEDNLSRPAAGYIWDRCAQAGLSYRSYGEWIQNGKTDKDPGKAGVKALVGHFDPQYRGFDVDYPDQKRADRFIEELARFEREGDLPRFVVMHLPNDHTAGTKIGSPTPTASVADNDLALGRIIESVSKSKFWKDTAVFVIEDDAQNGSDHVDAHRTVALAISPYIRRGTIDSSLYSTTSILRTIELILGLKPMSQFDAAARPMYAAFQLSADTRPYAHVVPGVDWKDKNRLSAWGTKLSEKFDFTRADAVDDLLLNEIIWRSVRGPNSLMPAPVRAAFVMPHPKKDKAEDDD